MILTLLLGATILLLVLLYFWRRRPAYFSVFEILQQVGRQLGLKEEMVRKYPVPAMRGIYFGFPLSMDGMAKKRRLDGRRGYRFVATLSLPQQLQLRLFLTHEKRKTSLKPIANLKWVTTSVPQFNESFLLLANPVPRAAAVFQPYLCEKILSLSELDWQLDAHGTVAHFEVWQEVLNAAVLVELLKVVVECLNALILSEKSAERAG